MAGYIINHLTQQPLVDWNCMMAQLYHSDERSAINTTIETSSGIVSDDHNLTFSEHSQLFSSPRRSFAQKPLTSSDHLRTRTIKTPSTPSPFTDRIISCRPSPVSDHSQKYYPVYQKCSSPCLKQTDVISPETNCYKNRMKILDKPSNHSQTKITFTHPDSLNQQKSSRNKTKTCDSKILQNDTSSTRLNDLGDGLLTRIFQSLSSNELCKCAMVCKRWYELVWNPYLWTDVIIDDQTLDVDRGIKCLTTALSFDRPKACLIVESIDLTGCHRLTDKGIYLIAARCPKLKKLIFDGCREVTNIAIFEIVSRCIDLKSLSLSGCMYVTCISLTPEANLQATTYGKQIYLSHLDMTDCINVDDSSLQMIVTYCSKLSYLYLRRCVKITDVGVQYAAGYCNKLRELSISDCPNISDLGMKDISRLESNLRYLSIAKCRRISDVGLKYVARNCNKLRYINMRGCDRITQDGFAYLADHCTKLRSLDIGNCGTNVTDRTLESLGQCDELRKLNLKGCSRITDVGVTKLTENCKQLQQLNIIECKISSRALDIVHQNCPTCTVEHSNPGLY